MNLRKFATRIALHAVFFLTLAGCFGDDTKPLTPGSAAPKATLNLLDGGTVDLTDHPGRGLVVTFMSSWCPCSNDSIPMMKDAYKRHGENRHLAFLMVGIQDSREKFAAAVRKWEVPFTVGFDASNEVARTYGVKQPPTTVFIDRDGKVKKFYYGNIKDVEQEFQQWIEELL